MAISNKNYLTMLTDQAIGEGAIPDEDGLGFSSYSRALGQSAMGTGGPFTIGIFGEWGTGKTSLMRMIEDYLKENNVVIVWFNAWRFEQEEHPLVPLIATIIRGLEENKSLLKRLDETRKSLVDALRAVAYGFASKATVKVPGFAEVEASFVAKDMIERSAGLSRDPLLDRSLYYHAFEMLSRLDLEGKIKVVVFIDDLDRCFPDLAIKLLESIKLVLSQPGFVFILGVDRSVLEGYLQHRYETEYGLKGFQGQSYLDKIVQLPFHIPPHTGRMETFSNSLLQQLSAEYRSALSDIISIIGIACGNNPRTTKRFVNNLLIDMTVYRILVEEGEIDEGLDIGYFAVTRSLQQRWGDVFSLLANSEDLCLTILEIPETELRALANSEDPLEQHIGTAVIDDQELRDLIFSRYGRAWLENHALRRESVQFLRTRRRDSGEAIIYYSVFLAYSHEDQAFAERLFSDLQTAGVRCWFAAQFLRVGEDIRRRVEQAIRAHDKVLVILSEHSVHSEWIEREVDWALEEEMRRGSVVLFPVRLDTAVMESDHAWAANICRTRYIGDFSVWKDYDAYQQALDRLLRDLKAE